MSPKRIIVAGLVAASSACALIADLGDRTLAESDGGGGRLDGAPADGTSSKSDGAGSNPDGAPDKAPSFCNGIVFYASLDSFDADKSGGTSPLVLGGVKTDPNGRFGPAVTLRDAQDAGAALFYVRPDAGTFSFPKAQGSVSLWYRPDSLMPPSPSFAPIVYRWVGTLPPAPLEPVDLFLVSLSSRFGLVNQTGGTTEILTFTYAAIRPYLRKDAFNHYVTAWRAPTDGGTSGPTAWLALNGGTGERFDDAGADSYVDASPNDAGDLLVPYRAYTSKPWTPTTAQAVALRLGGPSASATEGSLDDLAVWDRILTFDEMAAVYRSASIGAVCKLR